MLRLQLARQLEDLRLDGHVERRRRLVGDQQLGVERERHGDHRRAAACRRRARAGSVERAPRRSGCRPSRAASIARRARRLVRDLARGPGSPRRSASRPCRAGAATTADPGRPWRRARRARAQLVRRQAAAGRRRRSSTSPGDRRVRRAREAQHGERGDALARARLADEAERPAALECERDAVDGLHHAVPRREADAQVADLEERQHQ